jgi:hypothetical protein
MGNWSSPGPERRRQNYAKSRSGNRICRRHFGWAVILGLLAACSQEEMLNKIASPAEQATARKYIDDLRHLDFVDIEKVVDPSIADELAGGTLAKMAAVIPAGNPTSVKLVGAKRSSSESAGAMLNLTYSLIRIERSSIRCVERGIHGGSRYPGHVGRLHHDENETAKVALDSPHFIRVR